MCGRTLSRISSEATPGYPAPDSACNVVATTEETPNDACNGASARASMIVEQFGLGTMNPTDSYRWRCRVSKSRCWWLTSGNNSGTSSSIRNADELLITG